MLGRAAGTVGTKSHNSKLFSYEIILPGGACECLQLFVCLSIISAIGIM
jgi:hypothetical protein